MHRVFLFGSRDIYGIPDIVVSHIENIIKDTNGEVEFIVGDAPGVDASFHKALSSVGAVSKSTIYCMDNARNNIYDIKTREFNTEYNPDTEVFNIKINNEILLSLSGIKKPDDLRYNREYYTFKDRQMCNDCTFAICIWDGKSKGTFTNINVLKAQNKYVYVYRVQV